MPVQLIARPIGIFLALMAAWLGWAAAAGATIRADDADHWKNLGYIENSFYDIALHGEFEKLSPVIRKWRGPLRVWVGSSAGDAVRQRWMVSTHLRQLSVITGLPVVFVPDRTLANVHIFFAGKRNLHRLVAREMSAIGSREIDNSMCLSQVRYNRQNEITRGTVVIPVERASKYGKLAPCVVEEVTQMLGLFNDSKTVYPTVFSDITKNDRLTGLDYVLIKLLYSPQLRPGMSYAQARPVIRRQLAQWARSGLFDRAARLMAERPLYAYQTKP